MADLEDPDQLITLGRASEISGVSESTLYSQAVAGRLPVRRIAGRAIFTTRRDLHKYLQQRGSTWRGGRRAMQPADYRTPDGEEPLGTPGEGE